MPLVVCRYCGNNFYAKLSQIKLGWAKFCSRKCKDLSQRKGKVVKCNECGKLIYRSLGQIRHSKSKKFFCSKSCQTLWRNSYYKNDKHPNWKNGINAYRDILKRSNKKQKCIRCGIEELKVLCAHHLDHNRKNNRLSNLVWLCSNCHILVHNDIKLEQDMIEDII